MTPHDPAAALEELAALYAAGALPPDERAAFETRLASGDPRPAAALAPFAAVAAALAGLVPPAPPPAAVKAALLERLGTDPAPPRPGLYIQKAEEGVWETTRIPGLRRRILRIDAERNQITVLLRLEPGAVYPVHDHTGPEECLVLEGDVEVEGHRLKAGDYQYAPPGSHHVEQRTQGGCLLLITAPWK
jgi:anti-sigma factor ChrR (cupin superfamily)